LAGLSPIIPIPFADDVVERKMHRAMIRNLLSRHGLRYERRQVKTLSGSCVKLKCGELLCKPCIKLCKKLCRTLTAVLLVKDCVDCTNKLLHEGWLLGYALRHGLVTQRSLEDKDDVVMVHQAILDACEDVDTRVIEQFLKNLYGGTQESLVLEHAATVLKAAMKKYHAWGSEEPQAVDEAVENMDKEERRKLEGILSQVTSVLTSNVAYWEHLGQIFGKHLRKLRRSDDPD